MNWDNPLEPADARRIACIACKAQRGEDCTQPDDAPVIMVHNVRYQTLTSAMVIEEYLANSVT